MLVLPWTFKFLWAPLLDTLRGPHWSLRHWIVSAQIVMGFSLLPLLWLDPVASFNLIATILLVHALAAATQDVAIDAYCISTTAPGERGAYNGWMQTGMLLGRGMMGGGALVMSTYLGDRFVIGLLIALTMFSLLLVVWIPQTPIQSEEASHQDRLRQIGRSLWIAITHRNTWVGLLFGATAGAAFKSLEVFYGPYLIDRGVSQDAIGWFSMGPMIGMMIMGSMLGGRLADRVGAKQCVTLGLVFLAMCIMTLAAADSSALAPIAWFAFPLLGLAAVGIGFFTAALYTLFMDISQPRIAATQFSAFMGSTNGCEAWSSFASGLIIAHFGYSAAMLSMSVVSLLTLPVLLFLSSSAQVDRHAGRAEKNQGQ